MVSKPPLIGQVDDPRSDADDADLPAFDNPQVTRPLFPTSFITFKQNMRIDFRQPIRDLNSDARSVHQSTPSLVAEENPADEEGSNDSMHDADEANQELAHLTHAAKFVNLFTPELPVIPVIHFDK